MICIDVKWQKGLPSTTTIPTPVFFDSLWSRPHPNPALADSFYQVYGFHYKTHPEQEMLPLYFTKSNNGPFLFISNTSVFDDAFLMEKISNIYSKGHPIFDASTDFNRAGYWNIGDTICTVKLCQIDKSTLRFFGVR